MRLVPLGIPSSLGVLVILFLAVARGSDTHADEPFHIQAHRGAGIDRPENTLESFETSWRMGVTPEADLRVTKDGVIVCFHDADLTRVVSNPPKGQGRVGVEDLTVAQVAELEVGSFRGEEFRGQRVPTLETVFREMRGRADRLLYLDIKKMEDLQPLVEMIRGFDVASQVIFTSTHHDLIRDWKRRVPDSLTLLWNGGSEESLRKKIESVRQADFEGITHLQIHVKVKDLTTETPFMPSVDFLREMDQELDARGIVFQVLPWECQDPNVFRRLLELGADSFATDYPEVTLQAVADYRAAKREEREP